MTSVDPPDRVKHSDEWLDWIGAYRLDWEDRLFKIEQSTLLIATLAETMVNGDAAHRRAMHNAIQRELGSLGIWPPAPVDSEGEG